MGYEVQRKFRGINRKTDFERLFRDGKRIKYGVLTLFYLRREGEGVRLCVIVPKSRGKATKRNRVRRIIREEMRENLPRDKYGFDIAIVYGEKISAESYLRVRADTIELIKRFAKKC